MATPTTVPLILDPTSTPVPQLWDPILSTWVAFSTLNIFKIGSATGNVNGYHFGVVAMNGAGWFKGASGYFTGGFPAWVMVFNATAAPANGVVPDYAAAVDPVVTGESDNNWFVSPGTPKYMSTGIWIALSTTGGIFTATASASLAGTVEFYAAGT